MSAAIPGEKSLGPVKAPAVEPLGSMTEAFRLAAAALSDMQRHRVCPTASAYDLWLAYHTDTNPALTSSINEMIRSGEPFTPAAVDAMREEFELTGVHRDNVVAGERYLEVSDKLQEAANDLVENATMGRAAIRDYGGVLARTVERLIAQPSAQSSKEVVAELTAETLRMAERNLDLKEQLAATSAKVEKLRRMLADEKRASSTDPLTGLANRRAFMARIKRALSTLLSDVDASVALLLFDVDHFKRFNDTYGHSTGDLVLRVVGRLLTDSIKGRDIAARYGGEEFAILLVGADLDAAAKVARQICTTLAQKQIKLNSGREQGFGRVTISVGVTQLRPADSTRDAFDRADAALYAAKHGGRNRVITDREIAPAPA